MTIFKDPPEEISVIRILLGLYQEIKLWRPRARLKHFWNTLTPWPRPVRKAPVSGWKRLCPDLNPGHYYWVKYYPEPRWSFRGLDPRLIRSFRGFSTHFYNDRFGVKVLGPGWVDPKTAAITPGRVKERPGLVEYGGPEACVFRLPKLEDEVNYYHFHLDLLGKLKILDEAGVGPATPLLVSDSLYRSALFQGALGRGPLSRRTWLSDKGKALAFDRLILAMAPPISRDLLGHIARTVSAPPPDPSSEGKIYVARRPPASRIAANSGEIAAIARNYGFEVQDAAAMDYDEQLALYSRARFIVSDHGASMANLIFRNGAPGSFLELLPPRKLNPEAFWLCRAAGIRFDALIGEARGAGGEDFYLEPRSFEEKIGRLLAP